jgi:putative adhesin
MRLRIGTWAVLAGLLALSPAAGAGGRRGGFDQDWCADEGDGPGRARYCEVREVPLPSGTAFHVDARPNGGVSVRGMDRGQPRLQARVMAAADTEAEARALSGEIRIETAGTIHAVGPQRSRNRTWWISYRLDVPHRSDLTLEADNGGLSIEDVVGSVELETVNGGLHLEGVGGNVRGETVNGGIHLDLSGTDWEGEGLDLRTTNGGLHLTIPSNYNARLSAGTVNGGVHSTLPVTRRSKVLNGGRIDADLGNGGPLLKVQTTNGGLHVDRR